MDCDEEDCGTLGAQADTKAINTKIPTTNLKICIVIFDYMLFKYFPIYPKKIEYKKKLVSIVKLNVLFKTIKNQKTFPKL